MAKLLVIDDDQDTCEYLKDFFEQRKCIVRIADSGAKGMSIIEKYKPDIVLLDIKMEGMNGFQVLKKIKEINKAIKVIVITVASDEETRQKAKALGADDFIKKPLNSVYLEGAVSLNVSNLAKERKNINENP